MKSLRKVLEGYVPSGSRVINNSKLRKELDKLGYSDIELLKAYGYFYITSKKRTFVDDMIYVNSFNQLSIPEWITEIDRLVKNSI